MNCKEGSDVTVSPLKRYATGTPSVSTITSMIEAGVESTAARSDATLLPGGTVTEVAAEGGPALLPQEAPEGVLYVSVNGDTLLACDDIAW
jgi:hypothetical protein